MAEVRDAHGGQAGAVREDEAAAGDAVGPEALLGRETEGKAGGPRAGGQRDTSATTAPPAAHTHAHTHTEGSGPPVQAAVRAGASRPGRQPRTSY